jgi:hypothetical protein
MDKEIEEMSDEELESIIRLNENPNIPGSRFQKAKIELELRDRRRNQEKPVQKRWWEQTWVQIVAVFGAIASIVGLILFLLSLNGKI